MNGNIGSLIGQYNRLVVIFDNEVYAILEAEPLHAFREELRKAGGFEEIGTLLESIDERDGFAVLDSDCFGAAGVKLRHRRGTTYFIGAAGAPRSGQVVMTPVESTRLGA